MSFRLAMLPLLPPLSRNFSDKSYGRHHGGAPVHTCFGHGTDRIQRSVALQKAPPFSLSLLLSFLGIHVVLGIAMKRLPTLATAHAWLIFLVALWWAVRSRSPKGLIPAIGYFAASEVLWRMVGAGVFWEFGKYAVSAVILAALCRFRPARVNGLALLYFGLLLPSVFLTCLALPDFGLLRRALSSSLSGPLSLALCTLFLFRMKLSRIDISRLLVAILGPITGVAAICAFGIASLDADFEFGTESNFDASGGFGPVQVSAILGWGILVSFLWMQRQVRLSPCWWLGFLLVLYFAAQAVITFSRTGIWIGVITVGTALLFTIRDRRNLFPTAVGAVLVFGIFYFLIFPALDNFTGGKLAMRYSEKGFGNRENIAYDDVRLFLRNPLLGVGPGMVKIERIRQLGTGGAAHTEFTRLLAEHGLAGVGSVIALLAMGILAIGATGEAKQKAWSASLLAFSMLFMMSLGMRLSVPAVTMGLAMVTLVGADKRAAQRQFAGAIRFGP